MPERYQLEVFMGMYDEKVVLCGANSYEEKYYLNPYFEQLFDDIGSQLKIKQLQRDKQDLLQALQLYYKVFFLGEEINSEE